MRSHMHGNSIQENFEVSNNWNACNGNDYTDKSEEAKSR